MPLYLHDHALCGCRHAETSRGFASAEAPRHYPPDLSIEPVHLHIDLHVQIDRERAEGRVTHTLRVNTPGARKLRLHAVDLQIAAVTDTSQARPLEVSWRHDGERLVVTWPEGLEAGSERALAIDYSVERPTSGLYFSSPSAAYPERARWACTDHETERARHWLPCVDLPQVRCTLEFALRAEKGFTILANGALQSEEEHEDGETKVARWRLDWPCPSYITCFALGEFTRLDEGAYEGAPLAYFAARPHTKATLKRTFGRTEAMLSWMTAKLDAPYPYPKYFQFALPGIGGAMENISLVSWDELFLLDETLALEWEWLVDQINVHEMAHSYFGDAIVCRDFAHAWLKESWATYMESCWLEHARGREELEYDVYRNAQSYFFEADTRYKRPIVTRAFDTSWHMYDRHLYPGGGARLHMLRRELGDEVFWGGVRDYVSAQMGCVVETHHFREAMERRSGRSLVKWFDQWIHSAGYPDLKVEYSWEEEKKRARFTITQRQVDEKLVQDGSRPRKDPVFEVELEIGWWAGATSRIERVLLDRRVKEHVIEMPQRPDRVVIDPAQKVVIKLDFNPGQDLLKAQLERCEHVVARIRAARELIATAKDEAIEVVLDHYSNRERFWGVKHQILEALGRTQTERALKALLSIASSEREPMLLEPMILALGEYRDEALVGALVRLLNRGLPYRARMAAYVALGEQREAAPHALLEEAALERGSFSSFAQVGALQGLAKTRRVEALKLLLEVARRGAKAHTLRARAAACEALGELALYLDERDRERATDQLQALLRDADQQVALAAAHGLIEARATKARGAIEALAKRLAHQDRVNLERAVQQIAGSAEGDRLRALEAQLESLSKAHRELRGRFEKL